MATITQNNINFTNVKPDPIFAGTGKFSKSDNNDGNNKFDITLSGDEIAKAFNAIEIDWNGAELDNGNTVINTTGELLSLIQNLINKPLDLTPVIILDPNGNQLVTKSQTISAEVINGDPTQVQWALSNEGNTGETFSKTNTSGSSITVTPNYTLSNNVKGITTLTTIENENAITFKGGFTPGLQQNVEYDCNVTASYTGAKPKNVTLKYSKTANPLPEGKYKWVINQGKSIPNGILINGQQYSYAYSYIYDHTLEYTGSQLQFINTTNNEITIDEGTISVKNENSESFVSNQTSYIPGIQEDVVSLAINPSGNITIDGPQEIRAQVTNGDSSQVQWSLSNTNDFNFGNNNQSTGDVVEVIPNTDLVNGRTYIGDEHVTNNKCIITAGFIQGEINEIETNVNANYGDLNKYVTLKYIKQPLSEGTYEWKINENQIPDGLTINSDLNYSYSYSYTYKINNSIEIINDTYEPIDIIQGTIGVKNVNSDEYVYNSTISIPGIETPEINYYWYIGKDESLLGKSGTSYDLDLSKLQTVSSINDIYSNSQYVGDIENNVYVVCPTEWVGQFKLTDLDNNEIPQSDKTSQITSGVTGYSILRGNGEIMDSTIKVVEN